MRVSLCSLKFICANIEKSLINKLNSWKRDENHLNHYIIGGMNSVLCELLSIFISFSCHANCFLIACLLLHPYYRAFLTFAQFYDQNETFS